MFPITVSSLKASGKGLPEILVELDFISLIYIMCICMRYLVQSQNTGFGDTVGYLVSNYMMGIDSHPFGGLDAAERPMIDQTQTKGGDVCKGTALNRKHSPHFSRAFFFV